MWCIIPGTDLIEQSNMGNGHCNYVISEQRKSAFHQNVNLNMKNSCENDSTIYDIHACEYHTSVGL